MAQQTSITYSDDIDGGKAVETVAFSLDGAQYEIDVNAKNAKNLRKWFAEFIGAGRKVRTSQIAGATTWKKAVSASSTRSDKEQLAAIRAWATANGVPVPPRGRISDSLKEQYAAANGSNADA